jgi:hypothetical protein
MIGIHRTKRRSATLDCIDRALSAVIETLELRRMLSTSVNFTSGNYTQSFDTLLSSGSATTPPAGPNDLSVSPYSSSGMDGWSYFASSGTPRFSASDGSSSTGSAYSFGTTGSTDRALGTLQSSSNVSSIGVTLTNNTSSTITSFIVTYDGEEWRLGAAATTDKLQFSYEVGGTAINDPNASFTPFTGLDFTTPDTSGAADSARNGNSVHQQGITGTISGINWTVGQTLVLRWTEFNKSGTDDGLAVDNFNFSLPNVPVPGVLSFVNASQTVDESAGSTNIAVVRSGGSSGAVDVNYTIGAAGDTATLGSDYTVAATSGVLHFADGSSTPSNPISINITDDAAVENNETISFSISGPTNGATLGTQTTSTIVIHDNDGTQPTGLLLNEVDANPSGSPDNPFEFFELKGAVSGSLNDVYFVSIEGDGGSNPGAASAVFDLSGNVLGTNGLALVRSPGNDSLSPDPETTVINSAQFDTAGGILQNGANSFLVIYSKTTPIVAGADLDTDDNGTLEGLPSGAVVLDGVGWLAGAAYGAILPPLAIGASTVPSAATRDPSNTTPLSAGAWYAGVLQDSTTYDVGRSTLNTPAGEVLTGGSPNSSGSGPSAGQFAYGPSTYNINENVGSITIPIYRFGGSSGAVSVDVTLNDGSATAGSDYSLFAGGSRTQTVSFADGQNTANVTIQIVNDGVSELPESFTAVLGNPQGGASMYGFRTTATINIADDDIVAPTGVLLNEVSVDPPGTDAPNEYVEIEATPNSVLNDVYFVSVEGDAGAGLGGVDEVFNLTNVTVGSNGLILIRGNTGLGEDPATKVITSTIFDTGGAGLENGSNGFLLLFSPTTITTSTNLDPNGDGTLDLPSGASLLDGVGWSDGGTGDKIYGTPLSLVSPATNPPGAASRAMGNTTPNSVSAWYFGKTTATTGAGAPAADYNPAQSSSNLPSGAHLTPGAANFAVTASPPSITNSVFDFNTSQQKITLTFDQDVSASFDTGDITLTQLLAPSSTVPPGNIIVTAGANNTIVLTFQNYPFNALPDGRYQLVVHAAGVTANGVPMAADFTMPTFFSKVGDANRDGTVNLLDLNAVATNFGKSGMTFSQGDFTYNGTVDIADFNQLAMHYGSVLPASAPPAPLGSLFSASQIKPTDDLSDLLASE